MIIRALFLALGLCSVGLSLATADEVAAPTKTAQNFPEARLNQDNCDAGMTGEDIGRQIGTREPQALGPTARRGARCQVLQGEPSTRGIDQTRTDAAVTSGRGGALR